MNIPQLDPDSFLCTFLLHAFFNLGAILIQQFS